MKTKSYIYFVVFALIFCVTKITAQEYRIPTSNTKDGKLILENFVGELQVEGYEGKDVVFLRTSFDGDKNFTSTKLVKEKRDDSGIGLHIEINDNQVIATCLLPDLNLSVYKVKVPNNFSLKVKSDCERSKGVIVSGLRNDVDVNNCQGIELLDISGSIVLSSISGNIKLKNCALDKDATISITAISGNISATLSQINTNEPIFLNSISGNIVLTLPPKISANFSLNSVSGRITSDFDYPADRENSLVGTRMDFQANGGGVLIKANTVSGNIVLRKGE